MCSRTDSNRGVQRPRLSKRRVGLTVLEILVAATLAMVIIIAMVQIFATAGDAISNAKASLEISGQLRLASSRLAQDLRGVTVPMLPNAAPADGGGYFEYMEGPSKDRDVNNDGINDSTQLDLKGRLAGALAAGSVAETDTLGISVGDIDDVLMLTVKSEAEPFVGQVDGSLVSGGTAGEPSVIKSALAEIIWWTQVNDDDGDNVWDPGETVTVYRRVLLIRPDLNDDTTGRLDISMLVPPLNATPRDLRLFYNENDLSVRPHRDSSGSVVGFSANSLADLTKRENRFAHYPVATGSPATFRLANQGFPFEIDRRTDSPTSLFNLAKWDVEDGPDGSPGTADDVVQNKRGEDVILSNVTAFDVRLFDRHAPIILDNSVALIPGDPGYDPDTAGSASITPAEASTLRTSPIGTGAFVDLNYTGEPLDGASPALTSSFPLEYTLSSRRLSPFSGIPAFRDQNGNEQQDGIGSGADYFLGTSTATYCTWSRHYEVDGIDQDGDGTVDEGSDGLDNDNQNGVDDPGEYETSPPYPYPLRGIQVRFRVIEIDTKQVRQTSVISDFTPE